MTSCASYIRVSAECLKQLQSAGPSLIELVDELHARSADDHIVYLDQAWDAVARCLGDGSLKSSGNRDLVHMVLGENSIDFPRRCQTISFLSPDRVQVLSTQSSVLAMSQLRDRYFSLDKPQTWWQMLLRISPYEFPISEEDWLYTWDQFELLREFFRTASDESQAIVVKITY